METITSGQSPCLYSQSFFFFFTDSTKSFLLQSGILFAHSIRLFKEHSKLRLFMILTYTYPPLKSCLVYVFKSSCFLFKAEEKKHFCFWKFGSMYSMNGMEVLGQNYPATNSPLTVHVSGGLTSRFNDQPCRRLSFWAVE